MARVALLGDNSTEYVSIILDIWNNKDCVVLFDCNLPLHVAINMMLEANVQKCFIEKSLFSKYVVEEFYNIEFIVYEKKKNTPSYLSERVYRQFQEKYTQDEAVVFYSSGTTGESKGIILSHFAINKNAEAIIDYMNLNKSDCIYIAKSLSHSSTFTGELLVALKTKTKVVIAPTIVPPRYVLANIFNFKVTIICLNPTLLAMYIEEYLRNNYDLSSLRTIYVSGSILSDNTYNGIALTCPKDNMLHILEDNVYVEQTIDNKILVTSLKNTVFPIIRYELGDMIKLSNKKCNCGEDGTIIEEIKGRERVLKYVTQNGVTSHIFFYKQILYLHFQLSY